MLVRERIAKLREDKDLTRAQMADLLEITIGTYNRYENGSIKRIPDKQLAKIATFFEISFDDLLPNDPNYTDLYKDETRHMVFEALTEDEARLVVWYRHLSDDERSIVKQVRTLKPGF